MERVRKPAFVLVALSALILLVSCPNPLLDEIKDRVAIYQKIEKPDILVKQGDVEIGEGQVYVYTGADVLVPEDVDFTIWNQGKVNLVFQDPPVVIAGDEASMFTMPLPFSAATVAPGGSCTLRVRFSPVGSGTMGAVINIYSDDPDENPYDFQVRGTVGPEIDIKQGDTLIESPNGSYGFLDTYCDDEREVVFTVSNPGTAGLNLGSVSIEGSDADQFLVVSQPAASLVPRTSTTFTLRFQPDTPGSHDDVTVRLSSDDPDENPYTFAITGNSTLDFTPVRLSASDRHCLAVKSNGTVWAWGDNAWGQLGDGTTTSRGRPVQIAGLPAIVAVAAGGYHSAALGEDGSVWTWGYNFFRQLGDGTAFDRHAPGQVPALSGVAAIATGGRHTLALRNDGTVLAWGNNEFGQLGVGDTDVKTTIVEVSTLSGVTAIAAGEFFSLARTGDGKVWAWGANESGQLGNHSTEASPLPVQVWTLADVKAVAAGSDHAVARLGNGQVWGWGSNTEGQLGDGTTSNKDTPVRVADLTEVAEVGAGWRFTAVRKSNGDVYCLGLNSNGQLGNGDTSRSLVPVPATGLDSVACLGIGRTHGLAGKTDGTVWSWGNNYYGKLADGTSLPYRTVPATIAWLGGISSLAAGEAHTLALRSDGTVWAWGYNNAGQLGDGTAVDRHQPVQVVGLSDIVAVAAGTWHSVALKSDGTVWAWGVNSKGQLGTGSYVSSPVPVQASGLPVITAIAAGYLHTLAVDEDGAVWAWGWNNLGQLGDDTQTTQPSPVAVQGLSGVSMVSVSAGVFHSLALADDGTVWAWGQHAIGQLGIGEIPPAPDMSLIAVQVTGLSGITAIDAGGQHNLALGSNGYVYAWGRNDCGQVGAGTTTTVYYSPVQITSIAMVTAIAAGNYHSLAFAYGNSVAGWGSNNHGQVGDGTNTNRKEPTILALHPAMFAVLAAGDDHSVVKTPDTWVWSWGRNNFGQLGDASTDDRLQPVHGGAFPFLLN